MVTRRPMIMSASGSTTLFLASAWMNSVEVILSMNASWRCIAGVLDPFEGAAASA